MTLNINVETKNVVKIFALAATFTIGVFALLKMYDALILIMIAFFLAIALNPAVNFLSKYMPRKKRGPAIAIVLIATIATLTFLLGSIIPPVFKETSNFIQTFPETINSSFYRSEKVQDLIDKYQLQDEIDNTVESSKHRLVEYGQSLVDKAGTVGTSFINTLTVIVMSVLMLTGGAKFVRRFADVAYRDDLLKKRHEKILSDMYESVTGYVVGQVSVALIASIIALGALALLKVPYPLPLAGIVFIFGLIPLIGNTMAAILVVLATLVLKDTTSAVILLLFFILYQQIENITLQPLVQGKTTNLPPLIIFISVILGVALIGPIGGLFAIPAAGCLKVVLLDYFKHRDDVKPGDSPKTLVEKVKHRVKRTIQ